MEQSGVGWLTRGRYGVTGFVVRHNTETLATHSCMTTVAPECPQDIQSTNLCLERPAELF